MRRSICVTAALLACLFLSGCSGWSNHTATKTVTQTAAHIDNSAISVDARNGSIEIIADATVTEVQIDATLRCGADTQAKADELIQQASLSVERDPSNALVIKPVLPEDHRGRHGASFRIRVPNAHGITATSSNGKITVTGLAGELVADTSNGSIVITDHNGSVHVDTSNGSVRLTRVNGGVTVETSNGSVDASDVGGPVHIDTSNGSITLSLNPQHNGPIHLDSSNGSIRATVGSGFAGVMNLDTSNGGITVTDSAGRIKSQTLDRSSGRLVIGEGGDSSVIDTSNGRIEVVIAQ